eukprot:4105677-Ditylum_brightwellii.AAC.1
MEAMFFAAPIADGGKIFWCDLVPQHDHITKLVFAKNQVVGSVWDRIDPVVCVLACYFYASHMISCVICLKFGEDACVELILPFFSTYPSCFHCCHVLLWVKLYMTQDSIYKMRSAVPVGGHIAQCLLAEMQCS